MRITRLEIHGFGCLGGFECEVAPNLHLFWGRNEAGKSTLQRAVLALLYGFYEGDRARADENRAREQDAPWDGGPYGGVLEYELKEGGKFRVERDFGSPDVPTHIWDIITGREVTGIFGRGRHGNVPFMREHLGMPKRVFEACARVSHGDLFAAVEAKAGDRKDSAREIGETIVRLADTAGRDVSARRALERLEKTLDERVGGPRARAKPLAIAKAALQRAEEELREIERKRQSVAEDAQKLEEREQMVKAKEEELRRTRYLLLSAEQKALAQKISRLEALDQEEDGARNRERELAAWAGFPEEQRDEVQRQWTVVQDARRRLEQRLGEIEDARHRLPQLEAEVARLAAEESALAHLRSFPVEREGPVRQSEAQWREARGIADEARRRLETLEAQAAPVTEEFGRLETEVGWLTAEDAVRLVGTVQAPRAGLAARVAAALGRALAWLWRALRGALRWVAGRLLRRGGRASIPPEPAEAVGGRRLTEVTPTEAARLLQLWQRYQELSPVVRGYREAAADAAEAAAKVEEAERALRAALAGATPDVDDLDAALAEFWRRADQRRQLDAVAAQREKADQQVAALRKTISGYDAESATLSGLESALASLLEKAVGRDGGLADLVEAFEDGCARKREYLQVRQRLSEVQRERDAILSGRSPAELRQMLAERERALREMEVAAPGLRGARTDKDEEQLRREARGLEDGLNDLKQEISSLSATIETTLKGLRSRSEVEEDLERHRREVEELTAFGKALTVAREVIEEAMKAVHRDFAPYVGQFLGDGLARVTSGRYRKAFVDPSTFDVTVEVPEDGKIRGVGELSRGTQAAAYLLLRAGLAQHMTSLKEPVPLILDDPLVDLDDIRLENFLDLLLGLSENMQVLLFTKDEETRQWLEQRAAGDSRYRVTYLDRAGAGATR